MKKIGKKWALKAGETRADIFEKIGGSGGGARRVSKKAKTNVSKTSKADSGASGVEKTLYGDWNIGGKTGIVKGKAKPKKSVRRKRTKEEIAHDKKYGIRRSGFDPKKFAEDWEKYGATGRR